MALNDSFENRFNPGFGTGASRRASNEERPKAQFWMNVGYPAPTKDAEGNDTTVFVSLAQGIPLDTQETFEVANIRNANMRKLRAAQNALKAQLLDVASKLEPGDERIIACDDKTGLHIQVRRVNIAAEVPADDENELFVPLKIAG